MAGSLAQKLTEMIEVILAIDGGGSRTRCHAITRAGRTLGTGESGASNHLLVDREIVRASITEAINAALSEARLERSDVICLSAGLAGVDYDGSGAAEMEELFREIGFVKAVINGDMVIAHAGALGGAPGVLALAGTGSAILGIDAKGRRIKVGGWGPVYGDEGSAYFIGRSALIAAARAFDGRGPQTALQYALMRALGLRHFKETVQRIYLEKMEAREIASLCRAADETAQAGDEVARSIFLRAGEEMAEGVAAAIRQLDLTGEHRLVSYQGSVFESCTIMREQFSESLRQMFPDISVQAPRAAPVVGAFCFGCEYLGWPFSFERVSGSRSNEA
jgi:N-acetylglucosamine kinase-like BadF-type ATPase